MRGAALRMPGFPPNDHMTKGNPFREKSLLVLTPALETEHAYAMLMTADPRRRYRHGADVAYNPFAARRRP
jgi:hypothetical protein